MKTSTVAMALAASLMQTRALVELLCAQLDNAITLAQAMAEDATARESAHAAAAAPAAPTQHDGPRVFGRPIEPASDGVQVAPNAVGIVPADDTLTVKG